ncbi:ABC transporter ATP-binding protein [Tissierella sp.]|uniref:ABC transporter ATP-binding protein n=1 Tax=Tissierella sp. TaxID=41274 RepID=UPI00285DBFF9|nr:ABC transporter ATP-binding protein [Tissierella sp.]MDR7856803.1 ABC transporter ATP-binding protein [Tissierella sp.]
MDKLKTKQTLREVYSLIRRFYPLDHSLIPLLLLNSIMGALIPYISIVLSAPILDSMLKGEYRRSMIWILIMIISTALANLIFEFIKNGYLKHARSVQIKVDALIHMKPLEIDYETVEDGKTMTDFVNAITSLRYQGNYYTVLNQLEQSIQAFISFAFASILVIRLCLAVGDAEGWIAIATNPLVSIMIILVFSALTSGVLAYIIKFCNEVVFKLFKDKLQAEKMASYAWRLLGDEEKTKVIQSYAMEDSINSMVKAAADKIASSYTKEGKYWVIQSAANSGASGAVTTLAYLLTSLKVFANAISLGYLVQYSQAIVKMNTSVISFVTAYQELAKLMVYFKEIVQYMDLPNRFETGKIPVEKRSDNEYEFEFEDVSFRYPNQENYVLKNINCKLNLHDKMAIVGPNGAGKTTFIKLLIRLYEPTSGTIKLNGVDIRKYDYHDYLGLFSVVFQDFGLYGDNIKENVSCSTMYDEELVNDSLVRAGLSEEFIRGEKLLEGVSDDKLDVKRLFNEDSSGKHSGGEKQKISIARALYKNAPVVILDEPTAALDPLSEFDIYQRFDNLVEDKTTLYISHRMSSCRFCNDIIVFDEGEIKERGTHEELLENQELYSKLWNSQAQYYIDQKVCLN